MSQIIFCPRDPFTPQLQLSKDGFIYLLWENLCSSLQSRIHGSSSDCSHPGCTKSSHNYDSSGIFFDFFSYSTGTFWEYPGAFFIHTHSLWAGCGFCLDVPLRPFCSYLSFAFENFLGGWLICCSGGWYLGCVLTPRAWSNLNYFSLLGL